MKIHNNYKIKTFKDLIAWKKAYQLCLDIFKASQRIPRSELFGLTSQIKRSALSVPSNIAEGYSRHSTADYIRFLRIAYSSLSELETQLLLVKDLNFINEKEANTLMTQQQEVQRIMFGLLRSLN